MTMEITELNEKEREAYHNDVIALNLFRNRGIISRWELVHVERNDDDGVVVIIDLHKI